MQLIFYNFILILYFNQYAYVFDIKHLNPTFFIEQL